MAGERGGGEVGRGGGGAYSSASAVWHVAY